ncbi:MAG: crossover junction endodeoxyribonuclease RuvC [Candidatus Woesebacteria bacterium]
MIILGVDPGYDRIGWAILSKHKGNISLTSCDCILTDKKASNAERLQSIHEQLTVVIGQYSPTVLAIESLFFSNNAKTVIGVAEGRGVILLAAKQHVLDIHEYTPPQIKSAVTGDGQADKKGVEKMVRMQIKNIPDEVLDDTIDAIAIGLTFAFSTRDSS